MAHKTYVRHVENGKTAVLFIHGFLGSTEHFTRFISLVPENYGIYNILLKGHGGSTRDFAKASMKQWKCQVESVVEELLQKYEDMIVVGHSMGTFFAMDISVKYPKRVKSLFLLQTPLKIAVKPLAVVNSLKSLFNLIPKDDFIGEAYQNAHSVKLTKCVWQYIGWIPRYLELFAESGMARTTIDKVTVPCEIFMSAKDELVSIKSVGFIPHKPNINVTVLEKSAHFIYSDDDYLKLCDCFSNLFL